VPKVVTPILERFSFNNEQSVKLGKQLTFHFGKVGVLNYSLISMMKSKIDWPDAPGHATTQRTLDLITIPVALLLYQLAGCTEQALESKYV